MTAKKSSDSSNAKKKPSKTGRRSGADRRLKFITPYMKFVYNGDEKRSEEERRKSEERRKESRDTE
jgi:hypothetical protein